MSRILVIEDDVAILRGVKDNLSHDGYEVLTATEGETGYRLIQEEDPDLVILDLMLPRMNGYELCRRLRSEGIDTPVLMLTARSEEMDRVLGLDLGADDYVTKPFSVPELLARIRAILRRMQNRTELPEKLNFGDVEIDFLRYEAHKQGIDIQLSRKEFGLLRLLAARAGEVVTREELLDEVWGYDRYPTTRTIDNHVASLRAKLEDKAANPEHLLTVHGVGYRFVSDA